MRKVEIRKFSYIIDKEDDDKKEIYLKELGGSVHNYIRTGVKNKQLDDLIELEEAFQERYEERFDITKIAETVSRSSESKIIELERSFIQESKKVDDKTNEISVFSHSIAKIFEQIINEVVNIVNDSLKKVVKDTAYLSHMNMLYELYEQEEKLRRDEEEYDRISKEYQKMADVSRELSKQRRMEIEKLEKQVNISQKELKFLLSQNEKYFNIRERQDGIQISLSPAGRKYNDYIMNFQERYSKEILNQLVYKNCNNIMESLENSYDRGIEFELNLEKISPEKERALQSKYHRIIEKFISDNEEVYTTKSYKIREEGERGHIGNEKNRIRIPRGWDSECD